MSSSLSCQEHNSMALVMTRWIKRLTITCCLSWSLLSIIWGGSSSGKSFYKSFSSKFFPKDAKGGVPMVTLVIPLLTCSTILSIIYLWEKKYHPNTNSSRVQFLSKWNGIVTDESWWLLERMRGMLGRKKNDPNVQMKWFCLFFLLLPILCYSISSVVRKLSAIASNGEEGVLNKQVSKVSNSFGSAALMSFSLVFLLPVSSKDSNILLHTVIPSSMSLFFLQAHVWSSRIGIVCVILHGMGHIIRMYYIRNISLFHMLIPQHYNDDDDDDGVWINFTGFIAMLGMILILITSLNQVRRNHYQLFYNVHIMTSPVILIMSILHWHRLILYIAPSLLYYLTCKITSRYQTTTTTTTTTTIPWKNRLSSFWNKTNTNSTNDDNNNNNNPVRIVSVQKLPCSANNNDSHDCMSMIMEATTNCYWNEYHAGQYVHLYVPEISKVLSHPFTINQVVHGGCQNNDNMWQLEIIFRIYGPFTKKLAQRLESSSSLTPPKIYIKGFYGPENLVNQLMKNDHNVILAGGIGITPYLSMLFHFIHANNNNNNNKRTHVSLHWICRDDSLMEYVYEKYLQPLYFQMIDTTADDDCESPHSSLTSYPQPPPPPPYDITTTTTNMEVNQENHTIPSISIVLHNTAQDTRTSFHRTISYNNKRTSCASNSSTSSPLLDNDHHDHLKSSEATHDKEDAFVNDDILLLSLSQQQQPLNLTSVSTKLSSWWYVLTFNISIWLGLLCIWKLYIFSNNKHDKESSTIFLPMLSHLLGILAAIMTCIMVSFCMNLLFQSFGHHGDNNNNTATNIISPREKHTKYSMVQADHCNNTNTTTTNKRMRMNTESPDMMVDSNERKLLTIMTKQHNGRPSISTLLEDEFQSRKETIDSSKAIFLCGPKGLVEDVKAFLPFVTDPRNVTIHEELFEY